MKKSTLMTSCLAVSFVLGGIIFLVGNQENQPQKIQKTVPVIAPKAVAETTENIENDSPDGTKKLVMKVDPAKNNEKIYTFTTSDIDGKNPHELYSQTVSRLTFTVPYNAWSPDNSYVFIQNDEKVYIFKASGDLFANNQQYLDVTSLFAARKTNYTFHEATGWAAPTLLIFTTVNPDETKGPSYWFEVDDEGFIQLANH